MAAFARDEDAPLLRGAGCYTDDLVLPQQAYAGVVRSPHAHARIAAIDAAAARAMPGVLGVFTAADLAQAGIGPLPTLPPLRSRDGSERREPARHALAGARVRHVGEPVALVVAASPAAARDAALAVAVDYDTLPAVADGAAALAPGAPLVDADVPGNQYYDWEAGDPERVAALFGTARHVVALAVHNQRLVGNALEPRAVNAAWDARTGRFTVHAASQGVHMLRGLLARAFGLGPERFRVVTPDVGGGFGPKFYFYPEQVLCAFAARALGRPVKWTAERGESFVSDTQGRDYRATLELALDADGRMLALRLDAVANLGAYLSTFAPVIPAPVACAVLPSMYRLDAACARVRAARTNTVPVDAYRGSGKPEIHFLVERLVDLAAARLGIDRVELRRRNLVPAAAMPWRNALGTTYDSGDFPRIVAQACAASGWDGFGARRQASERAGRLRGIGMACYVESTGGARAERAEVRFDGDGGVAVLVGTQASGQGHATAYRALAAARLGVPAAAVRVVQGDSDQVAAGGGTGGSRSLSTQGNALVAALDAALERARRAAAAYLGVDAAGLCFAAGRFDGGAGTPGVTLAELARRAAGFARGSPEQAAAAIDGVATIENPAHNFP
ncbi:MAG: xanthine dehydrogenase family protein, partial [Burkholderiales bacterium]|nr:xanthine dehydrogenase family protein [Burkholderiales bacterium]